MPSAGSERNEHLKSGGRLMLYPIWTPLPRPVHFPQDPKLDRLLDSYDPEIGRFELQMKRRHARALRKGLFGPKGLRRVPDRDGGSMEFDLPYGWALRLTYYAAGGYDFKRRRMKAGDVDAEFIPPKTRKRTPNSLQRPTPSVEEAMLLATLGGPG